MPGFFSCSRTPDHFVTHFTTVFARASDISMPSLWVSFFFVALALFLILFFISRSFAVVLTLLFLRGFV